LVAGSIETIPEDFLLSIRTIPIWNVMRPSISPDKVKFHVKCTSEEPFITCWIVVGILLSLVRSGPRCGGGRVHVRLPSKVHIFQGTGELLKSQDVKNDA